MTLSELCRWLQNSCGPPALRSPLLQCSFFFSQFVAKCKNGIALPKAEKGGAPHAAQANHGGVRRLQFASSSSAAAGGRAGGQRGRDAESPGSTLGSWECPGRAVSSAMAMASGPGLAESNEVGGSALRLLRLLFSFRRLLPALRPLEARPGAECA